MMDTIQELEQGFIDNIVSENCQSHKEYDTPYTGDIIADFSQFTSDQSGRKSADPLDAAAKFPPPEPEYINGNPIHTVLDITWQTYHSFFPDDSSNDFYNMTNAKRMVCVMNYINAGKFTTSALVNVLLSYVIWGGSLGLVLSTYHSWYPNTTLQADVLASEHDTFIKLIDVRRYVYNNLLADSKTYWLGWDRGILNFYKLFKNYIS